MGLPNVNVNNFLTPGSNYVNTGAARNEQYRLNHILSESQVKVQPRKQSPSEWYEDHVVAVVRPRQEHLIAVGTFNSTAHVVFEGKPYTLPSVRWTVSEDSLDFEKQFGGLGAKKSFIDALDASLRNVSKQFTFVMEQNELASKKSKKLFSKTPKVTQKLAPPDVSLVYKAFNEKLAESRIPLSINEDLQQDKKYGGVYRHPSAEGGNLLAEMQAWSDSHWKGVPEVTGRDWSKEIITSLPQRYVPV